ncbi:hypothetical protein CMQ_1046 [Grosmannia clavigera kw1407]|uniref:Signal peptide-containing protein n=1 Tax=Grosmannia clavigera (strain kw1407 / UAMH 11150) TaxID=655863 RepID=F0XDC1_GROCL|nr:uncharacterized protein CMQ_1046 [Grosmannia clavigera kw1407]EFX04118.1 hypothetical protein CMQ_1046 [Grosmannia clavigera kw1407]
MAFPVAIQSALFYVLACTPCLSARSRYRTRKQSRRERKERARLDDEEPDLYRHPSPFNVNPYWQEEIMMGPSLPKKGRAGGTSKNTSQRKLTSAGKDSSLVTRSSLASSNTGTPIDFSCPITDMGGGPGSWPGGASASTQGNGSANSNCPPPSSPTLVPDDTHSINMVEASATNTTSDEGWNHKRYQREDEELWGSELSTKNKLMDAIAKAGSSAGRLIESKLGKERPITDEDRANFYAPPVNNPPVNEYHPPVVSSKPAHKDGLHWMLQPPPPAKVMEGKVPVSRSGSVASSTMTKGRRSNAAGSEVSLPRKMAMEARRRRAESNTSATGSYTRAATPSADDAGDMAAGSRTPNRTAARNPSGLRPKNQHRSNKQGRTRSQSGSGSLASSIEAAEWSSDDGDNKPKTKTAPTTGPVVRAPEPALSPDHASTMRPKLSTIVSSDAGSTISAEGQGTVTAVVEAGGNKDGAKGEHPRSASSSLDSGLALAA